MREKISMAFHPPFWFLFNFMLAAGFTFRLRYCFTSHKSGKSAWSTTTSDWVCADTSSVHTHTHAREVHKFETGEHERKNFSFRVVGIGRMVVVFCYSFDFTLRAAIALSCTHTRALHVFEQTRRMNEESEWEKESKSQSTLCAPIADVCVCILHIRLRQCIWESEKCAREWDGHIAVDWWCDACMCVCLLKLLPLFLLQLRKQ